MMRAIDFFKKQDYPNKELIIIDDSPNKTKLPSEPNINYIFLKRKHSIGYKRNLAVRKGKGSIFINWDDDDYHGCKRLRYQLQPIIESKSHITVLRNPIYFNEDNGYFFKHSKKDDNELWQPNGWICGTFACLKSVWEKKMFKNRSLAEDYYFIMDAINNGSVVKSLDAKGIYVINRHKNNTYKFDRKTQIKIKMPTKIVNAMKNL